MLLFTIAFGGLLLMMGHQSRSEALFYYFRLEDQSFLPLYGSPRHS
jgi:hypothetical protein